MKEKKNQRRRKTKKEEDEEDKEEEGRTVTYQMLAMQYTEYIHLAPSLPCSSFFPYSLPQIPLLLHL